MCLMMVLMNRNIVTLFCGIKVFCMPVYLLSTAIIGSFVLYIHRSLPSPFTPPPDTQVHPTNGNVCFWAYIQQIRHIQLYTPHRNNKKKVH